MALLAALVVVAELVLAAGLVVPRLSILAKLAFVVALVGGVLRWPMVAAGAVLVGVASVVSPTLFILPLGPLDLRGHELALGALLLAAVLVPRRRSWGGVPGALLAAFLAMLGLATGLAILDGRTDLGSGYSWARNFAPLLLFYPIVRLFPGEAEVSRLLTVGAVLGALAGLVALLVVGGLGLDWLFTGASERFIDTQPGSALPRVRLPGGPLAYGLLWYAASRTLATGGWSRLGWTLAVAGMAASVALSLNRNGWIGVAFGLVLLLALGGGRLRRGVAVALVVGASVAAVALLVGMERQRDSPLTPLVARGETLLDPRAVARSDSLQSRFSESERAWTAFAQRPLTGIGAGTSFGVFFNEEVNGTYRRTGQLFLHNQYLYLLVIAGIPGLIAFVGFLAGVIARARWAASEHAMACLVGLAMIMLSAVVMISFANPNNAVVVALLTGALMALPRERAT